MWRHLWLTPNYFRCRCLCTCLPHFCSTWNCNFCNSLAILDQAFIVGQTDVQLLFKPGQDWHRERSVRSRAAIRHCHDARNVTQMAESFKVTKIKVCPPVNKARGESAKITEWKNSAHPRAWCHYIYIWMSGAYVLNCAKLFNCINKLFMLPVALLTERAWAQVV